MPALTEIFGDDACLQFGGGTLGHPWGNAVWIWQDPRLLLGSIIILKG